MGGTYLLISQYVQNVRHVSTGDSGLLLTTAGLSLVVGLSLGPRVADRIGTRYAIAGGLAVGSLGFLLVAAVRGTGELPLTIIGLSVAHLCVGPLLGLGVGLVIAAVPAERAGSAASLAETGNYLGSMLTIPAGVPAAEASQAHQTVAGATTAAAYLPAPQAHGLLHSATKAFVTGLHATGLAGAIVFAGLAILTARAPVGVGDVARILLEVVGPSPDRPLSGQVP